MLLLVLQVLQVLQELGPRSMPRFWRVVRGRAGQHDGDRESPSFAREEADEEKGSVQGDEDGVSLQVVVVVVAVVLVVLVGAGTVGRG